MKNQTKVFLVKGYILFCGCYLIWLFVALWMAENSESQMWNWLGAISMFVGVILAILMVYMMSKVDIAPDAVEPLTKKVLLKDSDKFKSILFSEAKEKGFKEEKSVLLNERVRICMSYMDTSDATYVLETVEMDDFSQEDVEQATEFFWEETVERIGERKIERRAVALIQCICVKRMNSEFRKFVHQNVQQDFKRYQILTAISFGGKKAYICQTKGGFFRSEFRYLKDLFEKLTKDILEDE